MIRYTCFFLILLTFCSSTYSQSAKKSFLSVHTSVANGNSIYHRPLIGRAPNAHETGCLLLGVTYTRAITKKISFNAGLGLANHKIRVSYWMDNPFILPYTDNKGELNLLTESMSLQVSFFKYLFAEGGIIADIQLKNNVYNKFSDKNDVINNQSGIGSLFRLGAMYPFKNKFSIFTSLHNEIHGLIFFKKPPEPKSRLIDLDLIVGVRYEL